MLLSSVLALASATMIAGDIAEKPDVGDASILESSGSNSQSDLQEENAKADSAVLTKNPFPIGNPGNWVSSSDYPVTSLRLRRGGTVGFRLEIGKNGNVTDCSIIQSSGASDLDAAACIKIFIRAKFEPARDASGVATIGYWSSRIRWELPDNGFGALIPALDDAGDTPRAPKRFTAGAVPISQSDFPRAALKEGRGGKARLLLQVDPEGRVSGCTVTGSSGHADLDDKSCVLAVRNGYFEPAADLDGKPTVGKIVQIVDWNAGRGSGGATPNAGVNGNNVAKPSDLPDQIDFKPRSNTKLKIVYDVDSEGVAGNCRVEQEIENAKQPLSPEQRNICANVNGRPSAPYRDVAGKPVARQVTVTTEFRIEPVVESE